MKTTISSFCTIISALGLVMTTHAADERQHKTEPITNAVAVIFPTQAGNSKVAGIVMLKQEKGYVQVTGQVTGLTPGKHGFHIHMFGDVSAPDGTSAGGHYNPLGHSHGGPDSKQRHEGDLGNIEANARGVAKVNARANHVELHDIIGRSIVVHGGVDDLKSQPSGNAGPRVGIGVIGLAETKTTTAAKQ